MKRNKAPFRADHVGSLPALQAATANPSLIKRPLMLLGGQTYIGFDPEEYRELLM